MTRAVARVGQLGRQFWWIVSRYGNKLVILGPKDSEEEATEYAYQKLDTEWQIISLTTRNRAAAAAQIKARRLDATGDLGLSVERSMKKPPQEYKQRWWGEES